MLALLAGLVRTILLASLTASVVIAQGGYTTEKHPDLGLTFQRARDYEQIPTTPDEKFIVLYFAEKVTKDPKAKVKDVRPELSVLWIDVVPDPPPKKAGGDTTAPPTPGTDDEKGAASRPAKLPISSFERFVDQRMPHFTLSRPTDGKAREGWSAREYTLLPKTSGPTGPRAWAFAYSKPERTIVFVGMAASDDYEKHLKIWRQSAERVDFDEPEEKSTAKLEAHYAHTKWLDPAFRVNVRKKLVRGWQPEDTENYIVIYDTPDQPLMRRVIRDLELVRNEYEKLFPPEKPVTAVSTVRVCKNRDEYFAYGGPEHSAGYWNYVSEELVFYDAEKIDKQKRRIDADTFIVLYHEAFHQYIHYSAGELPPHSWFNEGHGDFFSGAQIKDGKVRGIGVNPWRVKTIQNAIEAGQAIPWEDIIKYEQPQYYDASKVHICYAQGWSMIYFLRMCKDVEKNPSWAKILPTYFATLKKAWADELAKLDAAGRKEDKLARAQAGLASRKAAVDAAFADVNMKEIQSAWEKFTLDLKPPETR